MHFSLFPRPHSHSALIVQRRKNGVKPRVFFSSRACWLLSSIRSRVCGVVECESVVSAFLVLKRSVVVCYLGLCRLLDNRLSAFAVLGLVEEVTGIPCGACAWTLYAAVHGCGVLICILSYLLTSDDDLCFWVQPCTSIVRSLKMP